MQRGAGQGTPKSQEDHSSDNNSTTAESPASGGGLFALPKHWQALVDFYRKRWNGESKH
jgi:hypothetical protein